MTQDLLLQTKAAFMRLTLTGTGRSFNAEADMAKAREILYNACSHEMPAIRMLGEKARSRGLLKAHVAKIVHAYQQQTQQLSQMVEQERTQITIYQGQLGALEGQLQSVQQQNLTVNQQHQDKIRAMEQLNTEKQNLDIQIKTLETRIKKQEEEKNEVGGDWRERIEEVEGRAKHREMDLQNQLKQKHHELLVLMKIVDDLQDKLEDDYKKDIEKR